MSQSKQAQWRGKARSVFFFNLTCDIASYADALWARHAFLPKITIQFKLWVTMLNCVNLLSSSPDLLSKECRNLKALFLKLKHPERLIDSTISRFNHSLALDQTQTKSTVTIYNPTLIMGLPRCKNLWSFSLFYHCYVRSIFCFDFFVFFVLRHSWWW